ncbi:MAG: ANTAR domain-containing protein [Ruminococcus sp.]|nr:ANTAR domain-containing protein [Ruminococcus sp.]MBR1393939.1 ANTAR domain-containing protein [Ruminococcus sp.]
MELKRRQYKVLIVSAQPKFNMSLAELIGTRTYYEYELVQSVSNAKQTLGERPFDIVIINAPLPDDDGVRLAIDRSSGGSGAVLLLVRSEYYASIFEQVCPYGVYTLPKPSQKQMVTQAFDWLESSCERLRKLEKHSVSLEDKMAEIRLVNKAKWLLISREKMDEEQAHHYIEKLAMDRCVTKRVIAEEIISGKNE